MSDITDGIARLIEQIEQIEHEKMDIQPYGIICHPDDREFYERVWAGDPNPWAPRVWATPSMIEWHLLATGAIGGHVSDAARASINEHYAVLVRCRDMVPH